METIFFEKQQAALCAQHALNMLLQNDYFSAEDLAEHARKLDAMEMSLLENRADITRGRSQNMDNSGFFSIQVIINALKPFDLMLVNLESPEMAEFKENPLKARAFICNHLLHWFVIRKFGNQWFELNSKNLGPKLLSDTYVDLFLNQLDAEGYSRFVVLGILPNSVADEVITKYPVEPKVVQQVEKKPETKIQKFFNTVGRRLGGSLEKPDSQEERDLAIAMAMSMETTDARINEGESDTEQLKKAIELSLNGDTTVLQSSASTNPSESSVASSSSITPSSLPSSSSAESTETPILTSAITPSLEQKRRDLQKFLERLEKKKE